MIPTLAAISVILLLSPILGFACDCNYHPGGCSISLAAPVNSACQCKYVGAWTCKGYIVACKDKSSPFCKSPDRSYKSCEQGDGNCKGYPCDCDYHPGGCKISTVPPSGAGCQCKYKGAWTCGGYITRCVDPGSKYCEKPDYSKNTCQQGGGDCGGY